MPSVRTIQTSFSAGEISPQLTGRVDLRDYRNGAAKIDNLITKATGAARSRPGLRLVAQTYGQGAEQPVRLFDFVYTNGDSYVVEVGARSIDGSPSYFRFHRGDQPVRWGEVIDCGPINEAFEDGGSTIVLKQRHHLALDDNILIAVDGDASEIPPEFGPSNSVFAIPVDGYRFKVSANIGGPPFSVTVDPLNTTRLYVIRRAGLALYPATAGFPVQGGRVYLGSQFALGVIERRAFHARASGVSAANPFTDPNMTQQPLDGVLTIGGPYQAADIFKLNYTQSFDVLTFTRNGYLPQELRREGVNPDRWAVVPLQLAPLRAPTGLSFVLDRGTPIVPIAWDTSTLQTVAGIPSQSTALQIVTQGPHKLANGDAVFLHNVVISGFALPRRYAVVEAPDTTLIASYPTGLDSWQLRLRDFVTGLFITTPVGAGVPRIATGQLYYVDVAGQLTHEYRVSAVYAQQAESEPSNILLVPESEGISLDSPNASITVSWGAVTGAVAYRVYKRGLSGIFGFLAEVTPATPGAVPPTSYEDKNLGPDLEATPPEHDDEVVLGVGFDPQAVAYFEQRRVFASPTNKPQRLWLTNSGTESQFTYTIPVREDDRVSVEFRSLQAQAVRHIIPIGELLVFTTTGEWRVTSINSDALTPLNISARQQSTNGSTFVVPLVMNDRVVYAAARGGHLRELRFQWQSQGFTGQDLSFRAQHLFDDYEIVDMAKMQAPVPIIWITSSSGALIGMSYVPDEEIVGFHRHSTERGTFESVACVPELAEDAVYVTVVRDGVRTLEAMRIQEQLPPDQQPCVDSFFSTYNTVFLHGNPGFPRVDLCVFTLADGSTPASGFRAVGSMVDVRFFRAAGVVSPTAAVAAEQVDELLVVRTLTGAVNRDWYRLRITELVEDSAGSWVRAEVLDEIPADVVPADLAFAFSFARRPVPARLEGHTVDVIADGVASTAVVTGGEIVLDDPALRVTIGLPYRPELKTLPLVSQVDGAGHGRMKNLNRVWVRLFEVAAGAVVGPDMDNLVPVEGLPANVVGAIESRTQRMLRTTVLPSWSEDGPIVVRQTLPFPITVLGLTLEAEFGD